MLSLYSSPYFVIVPSLTFLISIKPVLSSLQYLCAYAKEVVLRFEAAVLCFALFPDLLYHRIQLENGQKW